MIRFEQLAEERMLKNTTDFLFWEKSKLKYIQRIETQYFWKQLDFAL